MKDITIIRRKYFSQTTRGELYLGDNHFCYTLEDTIRPESIKVDGFTAIPEGTYFITTRFSPKFDRDMLMLYNDETKEQVTNHIINFRFIYFHGGNIHEHSRGCILVGYNEEDNKIFGTAEKDLYEIVTGWLDDGEEVLVHIINTPQYN